MTGSKKEAFQRVFRRLPEVCAFAPGRVNLIGEHTDYNGGYVLPCAIEQGVVCLAAPDPEGGFSFYSESFPSAPVSLAADKLTLSGGWADYPVCVVLAFLRAGYRFSQGAKLYFYGDLDYGAGLSSSAALEVACAFAISALFQLDPGRVELAEIAWSAENELLGVNCGIMDQFASALSKKDHALLLDTFHKEVRYVRAQFPDCGFLAVNSGVRHKLSSGGYNARRAECEAARAALDAVIPTLALCSLTEAQLEAHKAVLDDLSYRRARHAVSENARVKRAVEALEAGNAGDFGELMFASHRSLRDDFEVSCDQIDFLVDLAARTPGVYGARMTGGGFGGCTVNLVRFDAQEAFCRSVKDAYRQSFGLDARIYPVRLSDGARTIGEF